MASLIVKLQKYIMELPGALSGLNPQSFPLKIFLTFFRKKYTLKKILIFAQKKAFLIFSYIKKIHPEKIFLQFRKWNFLALILKKIQETETPKKIPYVLGNENPEKASYKRNLSVHPEKLLIFQETETPINLFIFQEMELSYTSRKQNFLIFPERYTQNPRHI